MSFSGKNVAERDLEDFNESMHDAAADEAGTELNRMSRPVSLGYATERVSAPMETRFVMAQPQHRRQTGSVKWFSTQRGYGFTAPSDGSKNVFVHYSSLKSDGRLHLQPNTSIEDEILRGSEGKTQAINATAPGGRLLQNSRKLGPGECITGSSSSSSSRSMSFRSSNTSSWGTWRRIISSTKYIFFLFTSVSTILNTNKTNQRVPFKFPMGLILVEF